jgi:hypothetical protein
MQRRGGHGKEGGSNLLSPTMKTIPTSVRRVIEALVTSHDVAAEERAAGGAQVNDEYETRHKRALLLKCYTISMEERCGKNAP